MLLEPPFALCVMKWVRSVICLSKCCRAQTMDFGLGVRHGIMCRIVMSIFVTLCLNAKLLTVNSGFGGGTHHPVPILSSLFKFRLLSSGSISVKGLNTGSYLIS
jgi:hypothetical protein